MKPPVTRSLENIENIKQTQNKLVKTIANIKKTPNDIREWKKLKAIETKHKTTRKTSEQHARNIKRNKKTIKF